MWIYDLAKKTWDGVKKAGGKIKEKLPQLWSGTKTCAKYAWHITQEGGARGHALFMSLVYTYINRNFAVNFTFVGAHSFLSFAKRFWKDSSSTLMSNLAKFAKHLQGATKSIPLLVTLGVSCGVADPTSLLILLGVSSGLSAINYILKQIKKNKIQKNKIDSWSKASNIVNFLTDILDRAGQGALFKDVLEQEISVASEEAAASYWMLLFIIIPAILEAIRHPLIKQAEHDSSIRSKGLANYSATVLAMGAAEEAVGYNSGYIAQLYTAIAHSGEIGLVTNEQGFIIASTGEFIGIIAGIAKAVGHKNKLKEEWAPPSELNEDLDIELAEILPAMGSTAFVLGALNVNEHSTRQAHTDNELSRPLLLTGDEELFIPNPQYSERDSYTPPCVEVDHISVNSQRASIN